MAKRSFWERGLGKYFGDVVISTDDVHYAYNYSGEKSLGFLGGVGGKRAIEVGCGGGHNSIALAKMGASVCGIDMSSEMIKRALANAKAEGVDVDFKLGRAEELGFAGTDFDIAVSAYVLDYVRDVRRVVDNVSRLLNRGGVFVLSYCHPVQMPDGCGVDNGVSFIEGNWPGTSEAVRNYFHSTGDMRRHFESSGLRLDRVVDAKTPFLDDMDVDMIESWPYRTLVSSDGFDESVEKPHTIILKGVKV
jgi:2-polyprenyl-3-methyl-5-hydroxy-6-metoxy-1,4-benzoquinol methylase